jgi:N utilization substance protein A
MDHGLTEDLVEKMMQAGVATVEKLGAMTPEELEEIPGIDEPAVEKIQEAVMGYYGQFEGAEETSGETSGEAAAPQPASEEAPAEPSPEITHEAAPHGTEAQAGQSVRIEAEEPAESH